MRVLVLAPQPFYTERGTPMSEADLLRVMSERGWSVDLLTYASGEDYPLPGMTIHRIPRIPRIGHVPPGFSVGKLLNDIVLAVRGVRMARSGDYDLVHGLEEGVFIAAMIRKLTGLPYVYDMDSILSEQLIDRYPLLDHVGDGLRYFEEVAVANSLGVVAVCESLANAAQARSADAFVARLEDRTQLGPASPGADSLRELAGPDRTIVVYVGNLESYQGIDLLLEGFADAVRRAHDLSLVVIGGSEEKLRRYRRRADELGLDGSAHLVGPKPVEYLRNYLEQADILASPRIQGTNTPMKIYSYLDAGTAVVATRLPTHLQALDDEIARLFDPTPEALADALVELARNPERRRELAEAATHRVQTLYSPKAYERKANSFLEEMEKRVAAM